MAFDLNWLKLSSAGKARASRQAADATMIEVSRPAERVAPEARKRGLLARYSVTKQLKILGVVLIVLILIISLAVFRDNRESTFGSVYIATAGDMRRSRPPAVIEPSSTTRTKTRRLSRYGNRTPRRFQGMVESLTRIR